jgi:hypothetical protein
MKIRSLQTKKFYNIGTRWRDHFDFWFCRWNRFPAALHQGRRAGGSGYDKNKLGRFINVQYLWQRKHTVYLHVQVSHIVESLQV